MSTINVKFNEIIKRPINHKDIDKKDIKKFPFTFSTNFPLLFATCVSFDVVLDVMHFDNVDYFFKVPENKQLLFICVILLYLQKLDCKLAFLNQVAYYIIMINTYFVTLI
jgi:hypothetical protein